MKNNGWETLFTLLIPALALVLIVALINAAPSVDFVLRNY
jgi:hypothetical protein